MRYNFNKTIYQELIDILSTIQNLRIKDLKYAGSIYNLLFNRDSNISFECVYTKMHDIDDNKDFIFKFEKAF